MAGLAVLLVTALSLVAVLVAGQRVRTGADLAALAAAGTLVQGGSRAAACASAREVATENGVDVADCAFQERAGQPWPAVVVVTSSQVVSTPWRVTAESVAGTTPAGPPGG